MMILIIMGIGLIPASIASNKGRSFFLWWLWGMAMFIIALPHALLVSDISGKPVVRRESNSTSVIVLIIMIVLALVTLEFIA